MTQPPVLRPAGAVSQGSALPSVTTIILVDNHDLVRQGVASLLSLDRSLQVVAEAASVSEGMVLAHTVVADVLVVDVSLGDGSGLELVTEFRRRYPTMGIVVLTMHQDDDTLLGALDAGASALIHKSRSAEDVIAVVHQAASAPDRFSAVGLADAIRRRSLVASVHLTPRETEVLVELAAGGSVAQVCQDVVHE